MNQEATQPQITAGQLAGALAKAQAEIRNPAHDATNPHFRNRYASLAAVRDAVVPVLARHGIAVVQDLTADGARLSCTTLLLHSSGEVLRLGPLVLPALKADAQGLGSAATYARRYALMAAAGVVGDADDDGNEAAKPSAPARPVFAAPVQAVQPEPVASPAEELAALLAKEGHTWEDARAFLVQMSFGKVTATSALADLGDVGIRKVLNSKKGLLDGITKRKAVAA